VRTWLGRDALESARGRVQGRRGEEGEGRGEKEDRGREQ